MFEATVYQGFSRIAWGVALAWIVFACVKGYGGAINSFLSWSFFSPLAKLCFMVYFIHLDITKYFALSFTFTVDMMPILMVSVSAPYGEEKRSINHYSAWLFFFLQTYFVIALSMVCFGVAFVGTLVVEAPFINLEKLLIGSKCFQKDIETLNLLCKPSLFISLSPFRAFTQEIRLSSCVCLCWKRLH